MASVPLANSAERLSSWLIERALTGLPPVASARELAAEFQANARYANTEERVDALVRREARKAFTAGFLAGLGGLISMPVTLPANVGAVWLLQARMAAAIAELRGYDSREPWVQSSVLLSLTGGSAPELLRQAGVRAGEWAMRRVVVRLSDEMLMQINRRVGFRLLSTATGRGFVNMGRVIPIAGALVGGGFDAMSSRAVAGMAKELFPVSAEPAPSDASRT